MPPKAKQVIYLHMVGGPPQMDLYDYKPEMNEWYDKDLPDSIRMGQRLTTMTSGQKRFPIAPSKFKFAQHGKCGMWVSELLPYTARMVDDMCFIRSMHTEAINHEPAITYMQTGNQVTGRPCLGAWASYGLGSLNDNLPTFVVLVAKPTNTEQVQAISARLWSSGYLSGEHAGVSFRSGGDPILYINNPPGVPAEVRRNTLDGLKALNEMNYQLVGDPETHTRIQQYELAFRMQASVPELTDLAQRAGVDLHALRRRGQEARHVRPHGAAGPADGRARRAVRADLPQQLGHARQRRRPAARPVPRRRPALLGPDPGPEAARAARRDAGHLGRRVRPDDLLAGRPDARRTTAATIIRAASRCGWPAAARGRGTIYGETDDFSYNIVKDPVHIHDFHATVLHLLGFDHQRFTLPLPGARPAADRRRAGAGDQGIAGVTEIRRCDPGGWLVHKRLRVIDPPSWHNARQSANRRSLVDKSLV